MRHFQLRCFFAIAFLTASQATVADDINLTFKGGDIDGRMINVIGSPQYVTVDLSGIVIKLPAAGGRDIGIGTKFSVMSDFEAEAVFNSLDPGKGLSLGIPGQFSIIRRMDQIFGPSFVASYTELDESGFRRSVEEHIALRGATARMKLVRVGDKVTFYGGTGETGEWQQVFEIELPSNPGKITLAMTGGNQESQAILLSMKISADGIPGFAELQAGDRTLASQFGPLSSGSQSNLLFYGACILGVAALGGVGYWLTTIEWPERKPKIARRPMASASVPAPSPPTAAQPPIGGRQSAPPPEDTISPAPEPSSQSADRPAYSPPPPSPSQSPVKSKEDDDFFDSLIEEETGAVGGKTKKPKKKKRKAKAQPKPSSPLEWNEYSLRGLERKAMEFNNANPDAVSYGENHKFKFRYKDGKLHGPFIAWHDVDEKTIRSLGSNRKEIQENLPKRYEGTYDGGNRVGTFTYYDESGRKVQKEFHGANAAAPAPAPETESSPVVDVSQLGLADEDGKSLSGIVHFDEEQLAELEFKAFSFSRINPDARAYGERYRFKFRYRDSKLHGPFVAWHLISGDEADKLGGSRKEIEAKLPKLFEGQYENGDRVGVFVYWNRFGQSAEKRFEEPKQTESDTSPETAEINSALTDTAVQATPIGPPPAKIVLDPIGPPPAEPVQDSKDDNTEETASST